MKTVKYMGISSSMNTGGVNFKKNEPYVVTDEVAEYLLNGFAGAFIEVVVAKTTVPKEEVREEVAEPKIVLEEAQTKNPTKKVEPNNKK